MASVKRKVLSMGDKVNIIKELDKGRKKCDVCREYNLVNSTVGTIWKNREKILSAFEKSGESVKRMRKPDKEDVDEALLRWFKQQRGLNVPISGPILISKAEQLAKMLQHENFVCTNGWLDRFKARHKITLHKICGEEKGVDDNSVNEWLNDVWSDIRKDYADNDIFNADETALFFKLTPDKTLSFKNEKCTGGKLSKERITVLVCGNLSGTEKKTLTVIGKFKNPRCFKNIKTLPVHYVSNKKAWMTAELFEAEIRRWDMELRKQKRKILLIVDNCPAHPNVQNLQRIKLVFLPPNCTSKLQPMDQGVIRSLKCNYRKMMLMHILECFENNNVCNINILNAIRFLDKAWRQVTQQTIQNAFRHAGFAPAEIELSEMTDEDEIDMPLSQWIRLYRDPQELPFLDNLDEFVAVDDQTLTFEYQSDMQIIQHLQNLDDTSEDEIEQEVEAVELTPGIKEAQQAIRTLSRFYEAQDTDQTTLKCIGHIEDDIDRLSLSSKKKQTNKN